MKTKTMLANWKLPPATGQDDGFEVVLHPAGL